MQYHCDLQVGGSHRTLLYGQAVLFLHSYSGMVSCLVIMYKYVRILTTLFCHLHKANSFSSQFVHSQYLSCLSSSQSTTDKLAFDVGLQVDKGGI